MARRGLATALQAALAGFGGYGQGVIAQREREQKRIREGEEAKRQALRDALAQQQFDLQKQEYQARFGPEALARAEREISEKRAFEAEQARLDRDAALARTTAAEQMRQGEERRQSRLGGQAFFQQARQAGGGVGTQLIGNAIANEVVRRGRQLTQDEISDLSAAVMGNLMGERKMVAAEYAANVPTPEELAAARARAGGAAAGGSVARRAGAAAAAAGPTQEERARAWMQMNPRRSDESTADYAARMRAAIGG